MGRSPPLEYIYQELYQRLNNQIDNRLGIENVITALERYVQNLMVHEGMVPTSETTRTSESYRAPPEIRVQAFVHAIGLEFSLRLLEGRGGHDIQNARGNPNTVGSSEDTGNHLNPVQITDEPSPPPEEEPPAYEPFSLIEGNA